MRKFRLNDNEEIVQTIREGLKRTGGYCPCRLDRTDDTKCICKSSGISWPTRNMRVTVTACCIISQRGYTGHMM